MSCPHCGSSAPASAGRCPECGKPPTPETAVTAGVLTPAPREETDSDETRLGSPQDPDAKPPSRPSHYSRPPASLLSQTDPIGAGQNFGSRYHIIRLLGVGGMGSVYQAWDQVLEVAVAIKVIRPDFTTEPIVAEELERRFKRELLLARQVTDPHVVRIHDIGEIDGIQYITMPYIEGSDLAAILKKQ